MKIKILRQKAPDSEPYWESFNYDGTLEISVAGMSRSQVENRCCRG